MVRSSLIWLVVAAMVAGCMNTPTAAPSGESEGRPAPNPGTNQTRGIHTAATGESDQPYEIFLSACWEHFDYAELPAQVAPGAAPSPWESSTPASATAGILFWDCTRVGFGDLELGPVSMVLEWHTNYDSQNNCTAEHRPSLVHRFAVTHQALAENLSQNWGLPVGSTRTTIDIVPVGPSSTYELTWTGPRGDQSSLEFVLPNEPFNRQESRSRWLYVDSQGAALANFTSSYETHVAYNRQSRATFGADSLFGEAGYDRLVTRGSSRGEANGVGTLDRYDNPWCET